MLLELKISQFAIIDELHLTFKNGLNILSGETGSGKSVLLKSLALLMGEKASSDTIRTGSQQAIVEGSFDLNSRKDIQQRLADLGIEAEEDLLIVRRLITQGDKSRVYLNGQLSTLQNLRDIVAPLIEVTGHSAPLIEMTGQHDNRHLLSKAYHLDLLDQHAGLWEPRMQFENEFAIYQQLKQQLQQLSSETKNADQRLDFLKFQFQEISKLDLQPGEDTEIEKQIRMLKNSSKLTHFVDQAENTLYGDDDSAISRINHVIKKAIEVSSLDPALAEKIQSLEQAKTIIDDTIYELRQHIGSIEDEPGKLENLESRLSQFRKLQKKFGASLDDILKSQQEMKLEIEKLENIEAKIEDLQKEIAKKELSLKKRAAGLHEGREKGSKILTQKVNLELADLNMKGVMFKIDIKSLENLTHHGSTDVEFMSQTSPKDPARPLSKFASGGELSRILLSLKRVVGSGLQPRTYLFDEVDSGVSGETAEKVGKKLKSTAQGQQVICVTHLPQVAAFGDVHFQIHKVQSKDFVRTEVKELNSAERVKEIARLISGEKVTKTSLAHAEELLSLAHA